MNVPEVYAELGNMTAGQCRTEIEHMEGLLDLPDIDANSAGIIRSCAESLRERLAAVEPVAPPVVEKPIEVAPGPEKVRGPVASPRTTSSPHVPGEMVADETPTDVIIEPPEPPVAPSAGARPRLSAVVDQKDMKWLRKAGIRNWEDLATFYDGKNSAIVALCSLRGIGVGKANEIHRVTARWL